MDRIEDKIRLRYQIRLIGSVASRIDEHMLALGRPEGFNSKPSVIIRIECGIAVEPLQQLAVIRSIAILRLTENQHFVSTNVSPFSNLL